MGGMGVHRTVLHRIYDLIISVKSLRVQPFNSFFLFLLFYVFSICLLYTSDAADE